MSAETIGHDLPEAGAVSALFEIAAGSVIGHGHAISARNNQDAYCYWSGRDGVVAVVTDGCGSGRFSELGARLGARLIAESLRSRLAGFARRPADRVLEDVRQDVLDSLASLAAKMGGPVQATINEHLLFTVLGAVITGPAVLIFSAGDGVIALNGDLQILRATDNAPAYLAYGLAGVGWGNGEDPGFVVRHLLPIEDLSSLLLGSDGVLDWIDAAERRLPGLADPVGRLDQFWANDAYFTNPDAVSRRLRLANRPVQRIDWTQQRLGKHGALLLDDTTLLAIRRRAHGRQPGGLG